MIELKHDPIEETEEYKKVVDAVEKKARERVKARFEKLISECKDETMKEFWRHRTSYHRFVYEKKAILKEEYGIEWKSDIELNPEVRFD